jgi:hypothetical protein
MARKGSLSMTTSVRFCNKLSRAAFSGLCFSILWPRFHSNYLRTAPTTSRSASSQTMYSYLFCRRPAPPSNATKMPLAYPLLALQNADTSNALIDYWAPSEDFKKLAETEGNLTAARDNEDGEKLQLGIDFAKAKGVIDPNFVPEPYVEIDVLGKTPDSVADEIIKSVSAKSSGDAGSVIVLCGLSGTGKVRIRPYKGNLGIISHAFPRSPCHLFI